MSETPRQFEKTQDPALLKRALERVRSVCKGNGVKPEDIKIAGSDLEIRITQAATYLSLKPRQSEKTVNGKQSSGIPVSNRADMQGRIDKEILGAINQPSKRENMLKNLMERDDAGFGLKNKTVSLNDLSQDYSWSEGCKTCHAQGRIQCPRCHGQRQEKCYQCHGTTMITCNMCRGTGQVTGPDGKQKTCTKCHGKGRVRCNVCHGTGRITCRQCKGTGFASCTVCGGTGYKSHIVHVSVQAEPHFEFDRADLPEGLIKMLEKKPQKLVSSETVKIDATPIEDEADTLGIFYMLKFPAGEMSFSLKGKEMKASLYGYDARLSGLPPFLEKIIAPGLADLKKAAAGQGGVGSAVKKASRYRLLGLALITASQKSVKETAKRLLVSFPLGLRAQAAKEIAKQADQAAALITRKPRYIGLALGLVIVALLYGLYYIGPGRLAIEPFLGTNNMAKAVVDMMIIFLGGSMTTLSIRMTARNALQNALGHLVDAKQRKKLLPKTRSSGWWGYAGGLVVYLLMVELTAHYNPDATPFWYAHLRSFIGL